MLITFVITRENKLGVACFLDYHIERSVYKAGQNSQHLFHELSLLKSSLFLLKTVKQHCTVDTTNDFLLKSHPAIIGFVTD